MGGDYGAIFVRVVHESGSIVTIKRNHAEPFSALLMHKVIGIIVICGTISTNYTVFHPTVLTQFPHKLEDKS